MKFLKLFKFVFVLLFLIELSIQMTSCSKSCDRTDVTFKIKCSNCSIQKPLNVFINGNGFQGGNVIITSLEEYDINVVAFNEAIDYRIETTTSSTSKSIVQATGSVTLKACELNSISHSVAY